MADVRLISAGDDIKLWDGDNYTLLKQINPHGHNISSLAWTQDNTLLASTSANSDKIGLTFVNQPSRQLPEIPIENKAGGLCLDFNSNSRYLLVGRSDNALSLYDCKSKTYRKSYMGHKGPVTTAQYNFNDSYIASGSETGGIILHHVLTGQGCTPLTAPNVQAIRQVQYSYYKKSWLASASDDGAVNLWDTNTRRLLHSFSQGHRAPASGVAFSPLSDVLLCSVGLDKRIHIYDLALKKILHTYMAESPLTSIDFMHDGTTFAAGSTRGKIYIYDLRQGRTPQKILNAHRSSVQALRFRNNPIKNPNSSGSLGGKVAEKTKGVSPNLRRNLPPAPADDPVKVTRTPESVNTVSRLREVEDEMTVEDIFSPIREGFEESRERSGLQSSSNNTTGSFNAIEGGVFSPLAENSSLLKMNRRVAGAEVNYVTSPLAGNVHTSMTSQRGSSFTQPQHALVSERPDPIPSVAVLEASPVISHPPAFSLTSLAPPSSSQSTHRSAPTNSRSENFIAKPGSPHHRDVSASPSLPLLDRGHDRGGEAATGTANGPLPPRNINFEENLPLVPSGGDSIRSPEGALASSHEQGRHAEYYAPNSIPDRGDNCAEAQRKSLALPSSHHSPTPQQAQPFQQQVIRHLIEEAMEDFRDQVHRDMLAMHTEMIRQFHIQLAEMQATVQRFSVNEELLAEVERLREENKRLRKTF